MFMYFHSVSPTPVPNPEFISCLSIAVPELTDGTRIGPLLSITAADGQMVEQVGRLDILDSQLV